VPTQEERRIATQNALLTAAIARFGKRGFDGVSVDEIAADAGVTRGALYHHFESKEALFEAAFRATEGRLQATLRRAAQQHSDPRQQLAAGSDAVMRAMAKRSTNRIALLDGPAVLGWARYKEIDEEYFLRDAVSTIARIRNDGDTDAAQLHGRVLIAIVNELANQLAHGTTDLAHAGSVLHAYIAEL
jgi:AcrR family transcriptional regulator